MISRRLPGRTPRPAPVRVLPEPEASTVTLTGRLCGAEGIKALEILHLDIRDTDQFEAQQAAVGLIGHRVRITVELVEPDGMALLEVN